MSILSGIQGALGIINTLGGLRERFGSGPVRALYPESQGGTLTAFPRLSLPSAMPGSGMVTGGQFGSTPAGQYYGPGACAPAGYHLNRSNSPRGAKGTYYVRNRHMNPLNASAARRAIRRIKGARKMLQSIERSLPKRAAPRAVGRKR